MSSWFTALLVDISGLDRQTFLARFISEQFRSTTKHCFYSETYYKTHAYALLTLCLFMIMSLCQFSRCPCRGMLQSGGRFSFVCRWLHFSYTQLQIHSSLQKYFVLLLPQPFVPVHLFDWHSRGFTIVGSLKEDEWSVWRTLKVRQSDWVRLGWSGFH